MDNDKNFGEEIDLEKAEENSSDAANRARNRTVMLTPEVTGQVRALLNQDRPSDLFPRENRGGSHPPRKDDFAPVVNQGSAMTGIIARGAPQSQGGQQAPTQASSGAHEQRRSSPATQAPVETEIVQAVRSSSTVGSVSDKLTPIIGFLVSFDKSAAGEVLELRSGRWIVSSEKTSEGNFLIVKDETVSPLHAIFKISEQGEIKVLDQLSEYGTTIWHATGEEEQLAGSMGQIEHGDSIAFGERKFHVCLIRQES